jgi:RNA polymerase sigma-70 factor (ECF subfamily)
MSETPISLLERLRQPARQEADWHSFVQLYTPLLYFWARRQMRPGEDPADLVQEVFVLLVRKLPEFIYDRRQKSFRGWLRNVAVNRWRDLHRLRTLPFEPLDDSAAELPTPEALVDFEEVEYRQHVVGRALRLLQGEFSETVWRSCWATLIEGRPPSVVAGELGVSVNVVYLARSRVLARLRQELEGLLD